MHFRAQNQLSFGNLFAPLYTFLLIFQILIYSQIQSKQFYICFIVGYSIVYEVYQLIVLTRLAQRCFQMHRAALVNPRRPVHFLLTTKRQTVTRLTFKDVFWMQFCCVFIIPLMCFPLCKSTLKHCSLILPATAHFLFPHRLNPKRWWSCRMGTRDDCCTGLSKNNLPNVSLSPPQALALA